eukprot:jgi/Ulvmu1/10022/UM059_0071.1
MGVFHRFADQLDNEMYNKLLCVLDMFGMEELTDFIRMSQPRETNKLALDYTLSMRPPTAKPPTNLLTTAASLGPLKHDSKAHSLQKRLKPVKPMPANRVQQLLAAGCPILRVANQLAEERIHRLKYVLDARSDDDEACDAEQSDDGGCSEISEQTNQLLFPASRGPKWMQTEPSQDATQGSRQPIP